MKIMIDLAVCFHTVRYPMRWPTQRTIEYVPLQPELRLSKLKISLGQTWLWSKQTWQNICRKNWQCFSRNPKRKLEVSKNHHNHFRRLIQSSQVKVVNLYGIGMTHLSKTCIKPGIFWDRWEEILYKDLCCCHQSTGWSSISGFNLTLCFTVTMAVCCASFASKIDSWLAIILHDSS